MAITIGTGALLHLGSGSGNNTFSDAIRGIDTINSAGGQADKTEITDLMDTTKQFLTGAPDLGTVTFSGKWDGAANATIRTIETQCKTANNSNKIRYTLPPGTSGATTITLTGQLQNFQ